MKKDSNRTSRRAFLATDAIVAMGILTLVALPLAYSFLQAPRRVAADYQRAVVLELVDGEAEVLAAGAGRMVPDGSHPWTLTGDSVTNLPAGRFLFVRDGAQGRLEWRPDHSRDGRPVVRAFAIRETGTAGKHP